MGGTISEALDSTIVLLVEFSGARSNTLSGGVLHTFLFNQ